jgi:hypothetical protein
VTRPEVAGLVRDLADYDKAFGIDTQQLTAQQLTVQQVRPQ